MGAILESISAGIIPILLYSEDHELIFNKKIAIEEGWAIDYKSIELLSDSRKIEFVRNFKSMTVKPEVINPGTLIRQYIGELNK